MRFFQHPPPPPHLHACASSPRPAPSSGATSPSTNDTSAMSAGKTPPPRVSLVQSSLQWICSCSVICSTIAICSSSASKRSSTGALAVVLSGPGPAVRAVYGLGAGLLAITGRRGLPADVACALPACAGKPLGCGFPPKGLISCMRGSATSPTELLGSAHQKRLTKLSPWPATA